MNKQNMNKQNMKKQYKEEFLYTKNDSKNMLIFFVDPFK